MELVNVGNEHIKKIASGFKNCLNISAGYTEEKSDTEKKSQSGGNEK